MGQYRQLCQAGLDRFCAPVAPFIVCFQDVDTIYLSQDTRELNLQDFTHLESR